MSVVMVYPRDASAYDRPNTSGRVVKVLHWPRSEQPSTSACGRSALDLLAGWAAVQAPSGLRCRRSGCQKRWDEYAADVVAPERGREGK